MFASPARFPSMCVPDTARGALRPAGGTALADTTRAGRAVCVRRTDAMQATRRTRCALRALHVTYPKTHRRVLLEAGGGEERQRGMDLGKTRDVPRLLPPYRSAQRAPA